MFLNILSVSEKLPVSKFLYLRKYIIQLYGCFNVYVSGQRGFGEIKQFLWCMRLHVRFMFFTVFKNLKSSFSVDKMPAHALDVFIENATKMV